MQVFGDSSRFPLWTVSLDMHVNQIELVSIVSASFASSLRPISSPSIFPLRPRASTTATTPSFLITSYFAHPIVETLHPLVLKHTASLHLFVNRRTILQAGESSTHRTHLVDFCESQLLRGTTQSHVTEQWKVLFGKKSAPCRSSGHF